MNIVIAGCGKIGTALLESLVAEGHNITIMDTDEELVNQLSDIYDVIPVAGIATDCDSLRSAAVETAELFIACTYSDELNMLSCFLAKKLGAKHTIARIRDPKYTKESIKFMRKHLDISMSISPEYLTAKEIFNILNVPAAAKIETFSRRNFEMIEVKLKPESVLNGKSLMQIRSHYPAEILVCIVKRGDEVFIPDGNFVLQEGDRIGITATATEIQKFFREIGVTQKQAKNVMIMGGSHIATYLARMLNLAGTFNVKIIERDMEKCKALSNALPKCVIINGDGDQHELLNEEGIQHMNAFVALTGMDEENMIMSYYANSVDVPIVVSKINRDEMCIMAEKLGIECVVSPKKIVGDMVVRYARALENSIGSSVETLYKLMDGSAEAIEFISNENTKINNIPLKDLSLKSNVIIAGYIRDKVPHIPNGSSVLQEGDKVIVIATDEKINNLNDVLKV